MTNADGRRIEELTEFSRIHHDTHAADLTEILFERIRNVSHIYDSSYLYVNYRAIID